MSMKYTVIVEKGRESGYTAHCPALRGCVAQGRSKRQVLANLKKAIQDYVQCLMEDGLPVPTETGRETVEVAILTH